MPVISTASQKTAVFYQRDFPGFMYGHQAVLCCIGSFGQQGNLPVAGQW
ncbi:MAG TPA: hypothetical protein PL166_01345 [Candidatus Contendobacter sp.]|nr:hypothetical protein [Candidatus Contendobacter sp.]HRD48241.1 hypothetical protein [Candidatus Contendobacter sp.]